MELWEVVARESIRDLVARYNANGDAGRFAQVIELFAADAVMELSDRSYVGLDQIVTIFTGAKDTIRGGAAPSYVRHSTATHQIDLHDDASATGRMYFTVISSIGLDHWGRYIDRYVVVDGAWKFSHRRVIVDGYSPGSIFQS